MALFKEFHVVAGEVENVASKLVMKDIPDFDALLKIESPNALLERLEELAEEVPGDNGDKLSSIVIALKIQLAQFMDQKKGTMPKHSKHL